MEPRKALGKGLDSLIPKSQVPRAVPDSVDTTSPFREVAITAIRASASQPRKYFDEERIEELAQMLGTLTKSTRQSAWEILEQVAHVKLKMLEGEECLDQPRSARKRLS